MILIKFCQILSLGENIPLSILIRQELQNAKLISKEEFQSTGFADSDCENLPLYYDTGCPNKHGNSVTNSMSSLLLCYYVIICYYVIMSARVYFMKRGNDCKDVSIMSPQYEQWIFLFY